MSPSLPPSHPSVAIIGGGPSGLMAAERLAHGGVAVDLYDAMPSVGRKFLLAGKGGMNITHSEPLEPFLSRYGPRRAWIEPLLEQFGPNALIDWIHGLGVETFVGSSGRVFPREMKAAPLLRAWLHRMRQGGVRFHMRHRWHGWRGEELLFATPEGDRLLRYDAVVLALGGGSWARLGSDGQWAGLLAGRGVPVAPLRPANCGFDVAWSTYFREKFAGAPVKPLIASFMDREGEIRRQGEAVVTANGIEGGVIYALSGWLRDAIEREGSATLSLDLAPGRSLSQLEASLRKPRGSRSIAHHLRSRAGIEGVKAGLLREALRPEEISDPARVAATIKALPVRLLAPRPLDEAISSAGGVDFEALDERLMVRSIPGLFCAGEMLDWEAPTGGYLLTACFASGYVAGEGVLEWLRHKGR